MNLRELLKLYGELSTIALVEFTDIVEGTRIVENKLRIFLVDGTIYRYDNVPGKRARELPIFPKHFHEGSEDNIVGRDFGEKPHTVLRNFLKYVKRRLRSR